MSDELDLLRPGVLPRYLLLQLAERGILKGVSEKEKKDIAWELYRKALSNKTKDRRRLPGAEYRSEKAKRRDIDKFRRLGIYG